MDRRRFLKSLAVAGGTVIVAPQIADASTGEGHLKPIEDSWMGCLVDITLCIGCRKCEWACSDANNRDTPPLETYKNQLVFEQNRRPGNDNYTVVNKYPNPDDPEKPIFVKVQCMHCNDAACLSACIVAAFSKEDNGTVKYDPWKCMGCRYCMVACPYQIPTYEYNNAWTPQVRRCTLCDHLISKNGGIPACAQICPVEAIVYGPRKELIKLAHSRINANPEKYHNYVYGEHEVGGSSWMYLSSVPFEDIGFPTVGNKPMPSFTEPIQHGIFKNWLPQIALFSFLGAAMYQFKTRNESTDKIEKEV